MKVNLKFIAPQESKPYFESSAITGNVPKIYFNTEKRSINIKDIRSEIATEDFSLDKNGFEFLKHETKVKDLYDDKKVYTDYTQELEDFLSKKKNLNYLNKNGYYFLDIPNEKSYSNRLAGKILISDTSKFDIHQIDIEFLMNDYQYYLVTNWNTLLVLKSIEHLKKEMNSVE